jgi:cold shock CspA family protein
MEGVITRLVIEKGFGFVRGSADGRERFFHRSAMPPGFAFDLLHEGAVVRFEEEPSDRGPRAKILAVY